MSQDTQTPPPPPPTTQPPVMPGPPRPTLVEDETEFWGRQLMEHALFLQLGLEIPGPKDQAGFFVKKWDQFRRDSRKPAEALKLAEGFRAFQVDLRDRALRGEWLGWLFPLFLDHIIRELDFFVARIKTDGAGVANELFHWVTFMAEHAAFAAHFLDPTEEAAIVQAIQLGQQFIGIQAQCQGVTPALVSLSEQAGAQLDQYLVTIAGGVPNIPKARSVIHPILAEHVVREGRRFLQTLQRMRGT